MRVSALFKWVYQVILVIIILQQTNEQQAGYISFKNPKKSKSHWTVSLFLLLSFFLKKVQIQFVFCGCEEPKGPCRKGCFSLEILHCTCILKTFVNSIFSDRECNVLLLININKSFPCLCQSWLPVKIKHLNIISPELKSERTTSHSSENGKTQYNDN